MRLRRVLVLGGIGGGSALALLVSCLADPREDDPLNIVDRCDVSALSKDPASPESSMRAFVEATDALATQAVAVGAELRDACNGVNADLKLPNGADVTSACAPIADRLRAIVKAEPPSPPGALAVNHFVDIFFPSTCVTPGGTLETCISKCAGPCDTTKCSSPQKVAGLCNGDCLGSCTETGDSIPCLGKCVGEATIDAGSCQGECVGTCAAPAWTGNCTAACVSGFSGFCGGTCTGKCNGTPIGDAGSAPQDSGVSQDSGGVPQDSGSEDSGVLQDSGDGSDGGEVDAGQLIADAGAGDASPKPASGPPGPVRPPGGEDGNCPGKCEGACSSAANGNCGSQCLTFADAGPPFGKFSGGFCGGGQVPAGCSGTCRVGGPGGNGSIGTCTGTCTQFNKRQCTGICRVTDGGGCTGALTNAFCEGTVACQQNAECANACQATALLAAVCAEPKGSQVTLVTDPTLYAALVKNQGKLGKALNELAQLRQALGFIGNRTIGDFNKIGLSNDLAHACFAQGRANIDKAQPLVSAAIGANPTAKQ